MSGGASLPKLKSIPSSLIRRQLVNNTVKVSLLNEGKLTRTADHEINFSMDIAPFGKELQNCNVFWTGPKSPVKVTESDLIKGGSETISFMWEMDPMYVTFPPNQFVSEWGDGIASLRAGFFTATGVDDLQEYLLDPTKSWSYRFVVSA